MIARLRLIVYLVTFAAALCAVAVVCWGLATRADHIQPPLIAMWLVIGGALAQLCLWLVAKMVRAR